MNSNQTDRLDKWLFVAGTAVVFRLCLFALGLLISLFGVFLQRVPLAATAHAAAHVARAGIVLVPVLSVVIAVLLARTVEPRLAHVQRRTKSIALVALSVVALLPWHLQIRLTEEPVSWSSVTEEMRQQIGIQQRGGMAAKLVAAAAKGDAEVVRALMKEGADPIAANSINRWTPLHIAAAEGHADTVKALLDAGVPVDSKGRVAGMVGAEAIFFATMYGRTNVIALLVERGASLKATFDGRTPAQFAEYSRQPDAALFIESLSQERTPQPPPGN